MISDKPHNPVRQKALHLPFFGNLTSDRYYEDEDMHTSAS